MFEEGEWYGGHGPEPVIESWRVLCHHLERAGSEVVVWERFAPSRLLACELMEERMAELGTLLPGTLHLRISVNRRCDAPWKNTAREVASGLLFLDSALEEVREIRARLLAMLEGLERGRLEY